MNYDLDTQKALKIVHTKIRDSRRILGYDLKRLKLDPVSNANLAIVDMYSAICELELGFMDFITTLEKKGVKDVY